MRALAGRIDVRPRIAGAALIVAAAALAVELVLFSALYESPWRAVGEAGAAGPLERLALYPALRVLSAAGAIAVFLVCRPEIWRLMAGGARAELHLGWTALHLAGVGLALAPALAGFSPAVSVAFWGAGGALALIGAGAAAAPPRIWLDAARRGGLGAVLIAVVLAATLPDVAIYAQRIWEWSPVTAASFHASAALLSALGLPVEQDPSSALLSVAGFAVIVNRQCSGIEGFALITAFLTLFWWLFRRDLKLPHALLLLPIGIALSWALNIVRISTLVAIGAYVSPDLAVEGFHSHAGWLMFSALSLSMALGVRRIAWFWRAPAEAGQVAEVAAAGPRAKAPAPRTPFRQDATAAQIAPFIALSASGLLIDAFSSTPDAQYPWRATAMILALLAFWPVWRRYRPRVDLGAVAIGAMIGALWVAAIPLEGAADGETPDAAWVVARLIGAALLAPIVEELFFRGYLQRRLGARLGLSPAAAIVLGAAPFAALHEAWLLAFFAGVAFGALTARSGRLSDAIVAHIAANATIAGWVLASGDLSAL